jgi:putative transcriptional regulator
MPVSTGSSKSAGFNRGRVSGAKASSTGSRNSKKQTKSPVPAKPTPEQSSPLGSRIIAGMEDLLATMKSGGLKAVEKKFTVRRVKKAAFEKPSLGKVDVVAIRETLGVSQAVFANLLGVSIATVRAWEQGVNVPSGMATRFLAEIRANPDYWKSRLNDAVTA